VPAPNCRLQATQTAIHDLERGFELMVVTVGARIARMASA
jgi:hypothetical protein